MTWLKPRPVDVARAVRKKSRPIRTASPTLRALFHEIARQGITQKSITDQLMLTNAAMTQWKRGHATPDIITVEIVAGLLGFEVTLRKKHQKGDMIELTGI